MKKHAFLAILGLFYLTSCTGQEKKTDIELKNEAEKTAVQPKGSWKVDKEFDEHGNLIRYDSIYSWSSHHNSLEDLESMDRDSLLQHFESKFYKQFSQFENQGFKDIFKQDSLFSKKFFTDDFFESDFGVDFMELDAIGKKMIERQKKFLEKYYENWDAQQKKE